MDPMATMDRMIEAMRTDDRDVLIECGTALDEWFDRGGYRPEFCPRGRVVWAWWMRSGRRWAA